MSSPELIHVENDREEVGSKQDTSPRSISNPSLPYLLLGFHGDMLDDFEEVRIRLENRRRTLLSEEDWGHGLSPLLPEIGVIDDSLERLSAIEHGIVLNLQRSMRQHPLGPWVKRTIGIGEKQAARLLGVIGDPANRTTLGQLNSYCGMAVVPYLGDQNPPDNHQLNVPGVAPHRAKGIKSNWNEKARSRLFVMAESCIKQSRSPYRKVYDEGRAKYADAVHAAPCARCKAEKGELLSLGHQHARAMRLVMKAILRDLWEEARKIHGES